MPDTSLAAGLLDSARMLSAANPRRKPRQADLRRAISSCYYAVFHELARTCADALVGSTKSRRPNRAWVEVYRGLEHGAAKSACDGANNVSFPQAIKDFADAFKQLQIARHSADYDPMVRVSKVQATGYVTLAQDSIMALQGVSRNDKIAFATWVLITSKGAADARKRARSGDTRRI